jgi:hypothetical protein
MDTCVALVNAYLRFNGYVAVPEQPILVGQGRPYRYHTVTDVDIIGVRFPNAAVVVPRDGGVIADDDLHLDMDPLLQLQEGTVDVIIAEVKQGRPRLNEGLRNPDVLYATMRRVDPGFDSPLDDVIRHLIARGTARCTAGGRNWRVRLVAFGIGEPVREGGEFTVIPLAHVAEFLFTCMREHRQVWRDAQFGDPVLDLLHLFDKLDLSIGRTPRPQGRVPEEAPPAPETVIVRPNRTKRADLGPVIDLAESQLADSDAGGRPNRDERRDALSLAIDGNPPYKSGENEDPVRARHRRNRGVA